MPRIYSLDALFDSLADAQSGADDDDMTVDTCSQAWIDTMLCDVPDETGLGVDGLPIDDDLPSLVGYERARRRALRAA